MVSFKQLICFQALMFPHRSGQCSMQRDIEKFPWNTLFLYKVRVLQSARRPSWICTALCGPKLITCCFSATCAGQATVRPSLHGKHSNRLNRLTEVTIDSIKPRPHRSLRQSRTCGKVACYAVHTGACYKVAPCGFAASACVDGHLAISRGPTAVILSTLWARIWSKSSSTTRAYQERLFSYSSKATGTNQNTHCHQNKTGFMGQMTQPTVSKHGRTKGPRD